MQLRSYTIVKRNICLKENFVSLSFCAFFKVFKERNVADCSFLWWFFPHSHSIICRFHTVPVYCVIYCIYCTLSFEKYCNISVTNVEHLATVVLHGHKRYTLFKKLKCYLFKKTSFVGQSNLSTWAPYERANPSFQQSQLCMYSTTMKIMFSQMFCELEQFRKMILAWTYWVQTEFFPKRIFKKHETKAFQSAIYFW